MQRRSGSRTLVVALATLSGLSCGRQHAATPAPQACNGRVDSCTRRYNQVTQAATHNAFSYDSGGPVQYTLANQDFPITDQLAAGVRALGIRPCPYSGRDPTQQGIVYVTHNYAQLHGAIGQEPLLDILAAVRQFLDQNPREIVTLLAESSVTPAQVTSVFLQAGLDKYLYTHDRARGWPTLQQMIDANTRLVVFNDSRDATRPAWQHYMWDFIVDTDYNITDKSQFKCDFYRGQATNDLYFINQFIYKDYGNGIDAPDETQAQGANDETFIVHRALGCWHEKNRIPNFIYVDWYAQGNVVAAVDALNAVPR